MFEALKSLWNSLFQKEKPTVDQEVHPLPTEVVEAPPIEAPVETPKVNSGDTWPFPTARPEEVVAKPIERKRRNPQKKVAPPPVAAAVPAKKTAKEIAADKRKAAATKDRNRAKGKKTK